MSETKPDMLAIVRSVGGDPLDLPFWEACREGRFLLHRCDICKRSYWPASRCVEHGARAMQWTKASGRGTIYTYTVMHHAYTPAMKGKTPYPVAFILLVDRRHTFAMSIDERMHALHMLRQLQVGDGGLQIVATMRSGIGFLALAVIRSLRRISQWHHHAAHGYGLMLSG